VIVLLAALGAIFWVAGSSSFFRHARARLQRPYVVLVSLDALHVNYTSPYNGAIRNTPNLHRLAREGLTFRHAYTRVPSLYRLTLRSSRASDQSNWGSSPKEMCFRWAGRRWPSGSRPLELILGRDLDGGGAAVLNRLHGSAYRVDSELIPLIFPPAQIFETPPAENPWGRWLGSPQELPRNLQDLLPKTENEA